MKLAVVALTTLAVFASAPQTAKKPSITRASISPYHLLSGGGKITVEVNITVPEKDVLQSAYVRIKGSNGDSYKVDMEKSYGDLYKGSVEVGANDSRYDVSFSAEIFAQAIQSAKLKVTGTVRQSGSQPPNIGIASFSPYMIPARGGRVTLKVNVTDPGNRKITSVKAKVEDSEGNRWNLDLDADYSSSYSDTFTAPANTNKYGSVTYTATITATNDTGLKDTSTATVTQSSGAG